MPGRDGTGPRGRGPMSGRGLGVCLVADPAGYGAGLRLGLGLRCRRSIRRNHAVDPTRARSQKELFQKQKEFFENRLQILNEKLAGL